MSLLLRLESVLLAGQAKFSLSQPLGLISAYHKGECLLANIPAILRPDLNGGLAWTLLGAPFSNGRMAQSKRL
jgi:hypothetical protein